MKQLFYTTFLLLIQYAVAQQSDSLDCKQQVNLIDKAYEYSLSRKNIDSIQVVIDSKKITDKELISYANFKKALLLRTNNRKLKSKDSKEVLNAYKTAIDNSLYNELYFKASRLNYLKNIKDIGNLYQTDLNRLKSKGYKEEFKSIDLSILATKGKNNWLGAELSLLTFNNERWKNKNKIDSLYIPFDCPVKIELLNFAYLQNLTNNGFDFSMSLFKMSTPLFLDLTKFGFQNNNNTGLKYWYYRPEIGVGWGSYSLYYSYNFSLEKQSSPFYEKHLLNLRIALPVLKWH